MKKGWAILERYKHGRGTVRCSNGKKSLVHRRQSSKHRELLKGPA